KFARLRAKKRPVYCHAHELDNSSLRFAVGSCDRLWVCAAGDVATVGFAAELAYLKGAFDKVGVQADMLAMGKYKIGDESLTRSEPSEDSRENLRQTLADLRRVWLAGISAGREDGETLRALVEDGPWTPERAKGQGLITDVGFEDQALDALKEAAGTSREKD